MKLWGAGTARSLRPIWVAEELGLEYEHAPIGPRTGETKTPEYTALNRKQKIPFLQDGDIHLSESVAICRYLIDQYPTDNLKAPTAPKDKVKEDEWCCYIYGELDETSLYVMRRHRDLSEIYGASEEVVKAAGAYAERHLGVMAEHLNDREYLMGDGFSLPDLLLVTCLDWATFYGLNVPAPLQAYKARIAQRPAYQKSMYTNYKELMGEINGAVNGN
ncbi:MAG: glutathione S-transferase family protein [Aquisalinus sp.]|nr:glutathione S-transferase family protein [Aquisalinus sp.]